MAPMARRAGIVAALLVTVLLAAGCDEARDGVETTAATDRPGTTAQPSGPGETIGATPLTFMAGFQPQANLPFVGVYVAEARGFFDEVGLDVTIEHSAGGGEHLQLLGAGQVDVTTQDAAVLLERRADPGLPLVSLALLGQRGQQAYAALADSGLRTPHDWAGHTVGYKGTPPPDLFAILEAVGLGEQDVELVNVGFDPRVLTQGQVDVYPVFKSNEPDTLASMGVAVRLWEAADFGVPTLGLAYVATEETVASRPDVLEAFVDAALRGVEWASRHRDEAVDIVLDHAGDAAGAEHQRFMLDTELADAESSVTRTHGLGWQTREQWQSLADLLADHGALPEDLDVTGAFTTDFLDGGA